MQTNYIGFNTPIHADAQHCKEPNMTTSSDRASAQIYQFPARGRFAASIARDETPAANLDSPHVVKAAVGSGWYHEAAIEDAERARRT
jgi:hypothetical protein